MSAWTPIKVGLGGTRSSDWGTKRDWQYAQTTWPPSSNISLLPHLAHSTIFMCSARVVASRAFYPSPRAFALAASCSA